MTLIRDLVDIPERVHRDDFVLRLAEGVDRPKETLRSYVVTPQIAGAFDRALDLVRGALESGSSKGAYLHGSFGSGKSHFMAVLHLLLQRQAEALAAEGLEAVVTKHGPWLRGKRFLLAPYHMIGQPSMEAAVLGGYVRRVAELHPDAPTPGVYGAEGLFGDARRLRAQIGDEEFFTTINAAASAGGGAGWGELAAAWDAAGFEAAAAAPPDSEARSRLVAALVDSFFRGYRDVARSGGGGFVPLDDGLAVISRHARDLGYDGLVLFLDELILWLATHAADLAFLNAEGAKVSKLVEAEAADRPIPIVSFLARQRDLRDLVGEHVPGAQQLGFADVLRWWEARFETITLEDRNLPEIAARRLLRPKDAASREAIDRAYADTEKVRRDVFRTLLTRHADRATFRKVYPFSPALVETLVAVSALLQRERTALKVMLQLLVDRRDTLALGQLVPVGDLFDAIAEGDDPFIEGMQHHFENARRLYRGKLLPLVERERGLTKAEADARPGSDGAARAFRADDRLVKTLLLAALTPEVEVLRGMTAARLAALNHGSIRTPIEGREGQEVLRRCRAWAAEVGEVRIGDDPADPTVALQLAAVDTESILANASRHDNDGNRRRKVREILFDALGVADHGNLLLRHAITWRGTERVFEVIFANVRELPDESLATRDDERKVVIDFPFDDPGHERADDRARLDDFHQNGRRARTFVWLPAFLSAGAQSDLGTLVRLDYLLAGERLRDYAAHLSPVEQASAREILRNQQGQLRQRLVRHLEGAYGVETPAPGSVDESHAPADHFQSLDPAFEPRPPARANLRDAFHDLLAAMCESQFPAHPAFGAAVRPAALRRVYEQVSRAVREPEGRVAVDKALRPLMTQVAAPLLLGQMGETHFVLGRHWFNHFDRLDRPLTVARLAEALDRPRRMGLPAAARNLVILTYADQANLAFRRHGGPWTAKLDDLPEDLELREEELPAPAAWDAARSRAAGVFGIASSPLRNASNANALATRLDEAAAQAGACDALVDELASLGAKLALDEDAARRLRTARATRLLVRALDPDDTGTRIERLAQADASGISLEALGVSFGRAAEVVEALRRTKWELFEAVAGLTDHRTEPAARLRRELADVLAADEYAVGAAARLAELESRAVALLATPGFQPRPTRPDLPDPRPHPGKGVRETPVVDEGSYDGLNQEGLAKATAELQQRLGKEPAARLEIAWKLRRGDGA